MNLAKKLVVFGLSGCLLLGMCACETDKPKENSVPTEEELLAEFSSEKGITIGAWGQPYHSYEAYKSFADMGITHIFLESGGNRNFVTSADKENSSEDLLELEEWFPKLGVKAVWQQRFDPEASVAKNTGDPYYSDYECTGWLNMCDEPVYGWLDALEEAMVEFDRLYKDKDYYCFTNLWPSSSGGTIGADYSEYVSRYQEIVSKMSPGKRIMSVDVYPLADRNGQLSIDGSWLKNMYDVKVAAEEIDSDFHMYIQSVGYTQHRRPQTKEEIGFQVWTDLCFGIDGYTYFTVAGDGSSDRWMYTPAIIKSTSPTGEPWIQSYYDGCKEVNWDVRKIQSVYQSFDWKGVIGLQGRNTEETNTGIFTLNNVSLRPGEGDADFLKSITATLATVAGVYSAEIQDGEGNTVTRDALMISNYTDPKDSFSDVVTLEFADATHALVYYDGQWNVRKLARATLELQIACGEGAFVIPYKF